MRGMLVAIALAGVAPTRVLAQRYDYHLLLDSTVSAARVVLLGTGHQAAGVERRGDGVSQESFTTVLPDSLGAPGSAPLGVVMLGSNDRVTRIVLSAEGSGSDSVAVTTGARYLVRRLTAIFGPPLTPGDQSDWCWSTPRRFIDLALDRTAGSVSLTLAYGPPN